MEKTALLKEIQSYWGTRTEGYSEVNEKEWRGDQRSAWLQVLEEQFPNKKKEELRILDVGTGPGFFPRILAEAGYRVTAVDYTEGMLQKAMENTAHVADQVRFYQMDAQNLHFDDETFDVVISRNLTWNLQHPERAYREWRRVLVPGGKLINFDANWYGYLYDPEKRKAYEQDRENVKEGRLEDHYLCTDISRMERIAMQMPLSAEQRPWWDRKVLWQAGFTDIVTDTEIWRKVWSLEERTNYHSTPLFMVTALREN